MQTEITGKIVSVLKEVRGQGRNGEWVKNGFVVECIENGFSQKVCLEVVGEDKWNKMKAAVAVGNNVFCKFGVSSREYQGKWFTSCQCFYCSNVGGQQQAVNNDPSHALREGQQAPPPVDESGLPF